MIDTTNGYPHVYKARVGRIWTLVLSMLFLFVVLGPWFLGLFALPFAGLLNTGSEPGMPWYLLLLFVLPILLLFVFVLGMVLLAIYGLATAYIKTTPEGMEYKVFPYMNIRCKWEDVEKLDKYLFSDMLQLKAYEKLGVSLSLISFYTMIRGYQGFINLTGFKGWADGGLAADLHQFAPWLFEQRPVPAYLPTATGEQPAGPNQEERLLAALCHGSVILSQGGLILPFIIWLVQRGKSGYVRFQALQALVWQLILMLGALLIGSLTMVFAFGIAILPVLGQLDETAGILMIIAFVLVMLLMGIFALVSIAFVTYGIIGAIQTFRGQDFKYLGIGKMVEKRK